MSSREKNCFDHSIAISYYGLNNVCICTPISLLTIAKYALVWST